MSIHQLMILQFLAHLLADFIFQTNNWANHKNKEGHRSVYLYYHLFIVFFTAALLSFQWRFIPFAFLITVIHISLDAVKKYMVRIQWITKYIFFIDQLLHLTVIWGIVYIFARFFPIIPWFEIPLSVHSLLIIVGYILMLKPTNIIIKEIFKLYDIELPQDIRHIRGIQKEEEDRFPSVNELPNAGKLIGNLERILTFTLILIHQYAAVGFLLAAKSILRYKETDTRKTEYVLVGTLLSFSVAILWGVGLLVIN